MSKTIRRFCVPIATVAIIFAVVPDPEAGTAISSSTTANGTVTTAASNSGGKRSATLPCSDGSVRMCHSECTDGACALTARWTDAAKAAGSAGIFTYGADETPAPSTLAHQWCLNLLGSLGPNADETGSTRSTIRTTTINGRSAINGFTCGTAMETGVFAP